MYRDMCEDYSRGVNKSSRKNFRVHGVDSNNKNKGNKKRKVMLMGREQSLRQLIFNCNRELLKSEGMTRSELHDLTTWVLSTAAVSKLNAEAIFITEGNYLGLGVCNYDKEITLPRFLTYELGRLNIFGMLNSKQKSYKLTSYATFEELESHLTYATNDIVAIVDGEIVEYKKQGRESWGWEIVWGCDAYIVTYFAEDRECKEVLRSKAQLQNRLMQLVAEEAEEIQAYNIISGESLDFLVRKDIYYTTKKSSKTADSLSLTWCSDMRDDDEDEEMMF